jgi:hypothetical protein
VAWCPAGLLSQVLQRGLLLLLLRQLQSSKAADERQQQCQL